MYPDRATYNGECNIASHISGVGEAFVFVLAIIFIDQAFLP